VKYDGIRRIADRKARFADAHRVFRIFTETQGAGTKPRIKQPHLRDDFPLQGRISSSKIPDQANPIPMVDNRDIVFPGMALMRRAPLGIQTRKNSALDRTEVAVAMTLPVFEQPVAIGDDIVIGQNEKVPSSDRDAAVQRVGFPPGRFPQKHKVKRMLSSAVFQQNSFRAIRRPVIDYNHFRGERI
jgi:hypothetical protein